jgi:hypothetical protein
VLKRTHMGGTVEKTERTYAILDTNGEVEVLLPTLRDLMLFLGLSPEIPIVGGRTEDPGFPGPRPEERP